LLAAASARYRTTSRALLVTQTALIAGFGEPASADEAQMAEAVVAVTCGALAVEAAATEEFAVGSAPVEAEAALAMDATSIYRPSVASPVSMTQRMTTEMVSFLTLKPLPPLSISSRLNFAFN
jgi:hypothetical protein